MTLRWIAPFAEDVGIFPREAWGHANLDARRAVLAVLIDTITIGPATTNVFDLDRIDIAWKA